MIAVMGVSVYILIAIIAGMFLIIMALLGHDYGGDVGGGDLGMGDGASGLDHFDGGHGDFGGSHLNPLSLPLILIFFTSFGSMGSLFEAMDWNVYLTPAAAAGLSIVMSVIMYIAMDKFFIQTQASSNVKLSKILGMDGTITIPVKPGQQGQVLVITEARGRTLFAAVASEEISAETPVVIEGYAGNALVVKKKRIGGA